MATPLYSVLLAELHAVAAGTYTFGPPPDGKRWVVRDLEASWWGGTAGTFLEGFLVTDGAGVPIWGMYPPYAQNNWPYHWEGRQVIDTPQTLLFVPVDNGWSLRASGYELTLP